MKKLAMIISLLAVMLSMNISYDPDNGTVDVVFSDTVMTAEIGQPIINEVREEEGFVCSCQWYYLSEANEFEMAEGVFGEGLYRRFIGVYNQAGLPENLKLTVNGQQMEYIYSEYELSVIDEFVLLYEDSVFVRVCMKDEARGNVIGTGVYKKGEEVRHELEMYDDNFFGCWEDQEGNVLEENELIAEEGLTIYANVLYGRRHRQEIRKVEITTNANEVAKVGNEPQECEVRYSFSENIRNDQVSTSVFWEVLEDGSYRILDEEFAEGIYDYVINTNLDPEQDYCFTENTVVVVDGDERPFELIDIYEIEVTSEDLEVIGDREIRNIIAAPNVYGYGYVEGVGYYKDGEVCTLKAFALEGHEFSHWEEGGLSLGDDQVLEFIVSCDRNISAVFTKVVPEREPDHRILIYGSVLAGVILMSFIYSKISSKKS